MNQPFFTERETTSPAPAVEVPITVRGGSLEFDQPLMLGVPFSRGLVESEMRWTITNADGRRTRVQHRPLSHWPDGSIKWIHISFLAKQLGLAKNSAGNRTAVLSPLFTGENTKSTNEPSAVRIKQTSEAVSIETGSGLFRISLGEKLLDRCDFAGQSWLGESGCRIVCRDARGKRHLAQWEKIEVTESGPLRVALTVCGRLGQTGLCLNAQLSFHAGSNLVRTQIHLTNPRRARHRGGYWDLGDPGSVLLRNLSIEIDAEALPERKLVWREHAQAPTQTSTSDNLEIYQDSSGGQNWKSRNHLNRDGQIPPTFRGYRVRTGDRESRGRRASPLVAIVGNDRYLAFALEEFWQKFPDAIEVRRDQMLIHLWPEQFGDLQELQGGEQNSRVLWLDFGKLDFGKLDLGDRCNDPCRKLSWVHDPPVAVVDPTWMAASETIPFFPKPDLARRPELQSMLEEAIEGQQNLFAKRETIDEYGWRHFGDVWADHEEAYSDDPSPVISHCNNQYDLLYGSLVQFLQTGDIRWWRIADPLARHVIDIDIYHTNEDKSAYNGGLFWHTAHYHDAATSSHRSYSGKMRGKSLPAPGGGPANEHNYSSGLLLYYWLTSNDHAKDAVIGLADWVIAMDDGNQHLFGAFSDSPTGLATCTLELEFQGPGRGAGNSILSLTNAWLASHNDMYLDKASELIRRTIHPRDDLADRRLNIAEERWSYTVYLQALFFFCEIVEQIDDYQNIRAYAQTSILHYARWMLEHEHLYLDRPDELEYPTETWAAQDLRKGVVLWMAAAMSDETDQRQLMKKKGSEIFDGAWKSLISFPSRTCTRPIAIVLQQCYLERYFSSVEHRFLQSRDKGPLPSVFGSPTFFQPQKTIVARRLKSPTEFFSLLLRIAHPRTWMHLSRRSWTVSRIRSLLGKRS